MKRFRLCDVRECSADVPKYDATATRDIDLERRQAAVQNEGTQPRTLDSWTEQPYEFLCPLEFHEVTDISKWRDVRPSYRLHEGLYICQPLVGYRKKTEILSMRAWVLVSRILLGYGAGGYVLHTFWLENAAIERTKADFHRLGLPMTVADKAVEFDRGGVLALVDEQVGHADPLRYRVVSISGLQGIGYLHAEFLDHERARREQACMEVDSSLSLSAVSSETASSS